jgi:hypothetical protein
VGEQAMLDLFHLLVSGGKWHDTNLCDRRQIHVMTSFLHYDIISNMKTKQAPLTARRQARALPKRARGLRKATTYRLDPHFQKGLALLGRLRKLPVNRMVNEAVGEYLASRAAAVEADLEETLRRVRAYREADPHFESAIAKFADDEAALASEDPVEGKTASAAGPAQRLVRQLIRG